jgi:hypothetical protein
MESIATCLAVGALIMTCLFFIGLMITGPVSLTYLAIKERTFNLPKLLKSFDASDFRGNLIMGSAVLWTLALMALVGCGLVKLYCYFSGGPCI